MPPAVQPSCEGGRTAFILPSPPIRSVRISRRRCYQRRGCGRHQRRSHHVTARLCERSVSLTMPDMANRLHKLVLPWLLICPPVWAAKLPVPPVPPTRSSPAKVAQVPHRGSHAPTKAVLSRRTPIPPVPQASTPLTRPAPVPDQDAQPPSEPPPHTRVIPTDFRLPKVNADAGYPYGSRFRSPQETQPIQTPGFTVTIPLRLP